jgi:hypothetical protein
MITIPVYPQVSARWITSIELDGIQYTLRFDWSTRESLWYMDILDLDGNAILTSICLLPSYYLLAQYIGVPNIPPGEFILLDEESNIDTAIVTYDNLGDRFKLNYLELVEL